MFASASPEICAPSTGGHRGATRGARVNHVHREQRTARCLETGELVGKPARVGNPPPKTGENNASTRRSRRRTDVAGASVQSAYFGAPTDFLLAIPAAFINSGW